MKGNKYCPELIVSRAGGENEKRLQGCWLVQEYLRWLNEGGCGEHVLLQAQSLRTSQPKCLEMMVQA